MSMYGIREPVCFIYLFATESSDQPKSFKPYAESWAVYHFKKGEKHKWQIN